MKKLLLITAFALFACGKEVPRDVEIIQECAPESGLSMFIFNGQQYDYASFKNVLFPFFGYSAPYRISELCGNKNGNINLFAKYKPVRHPSTSPLTDLQREGRQYGINVPDFGSTLWSYNQPTGGIQSPFRLSDFNGYDHRAVNPVEFRFPDILYNNYYTDVNFMFDEMTDTNGVAWGNSASVSLYDLFPEETYGATYPCVVVVSSSPSGVQSTRYITTDRTLKDLNTTGDKDIYIKIPVEHMPTGSSATVWAALSKIKDTTGNNTPSSNSDIFSLNAGTLANKSYTVQNYQHTTGVVFVSGGIEWSVLNSNTVTIDVVNFVARNSSGSSTGTLTFEGRYILYDYDGRVLYEGLFGSGNASFAGYEEKTIRFGGTNGRVDLTVYNSPIIEEVELYLSISVKDTSGNIRYIWEDFAYPFNN